MQLRIVRKLNSVVLRVALYIAARQVVTVTGFRKSHAFCFDELANATIELLRVVYKLAASDKVQNQIAWTIVKAYLWSAWQRIAILYCYDIFDESLNDDHPKDTIARSQGIELIPELSRLRRAELSRQLRATPYLCAWSYRLLFSTPISITTDFGAFFQAYSRLHDMKGARCNDHKQCDGSSSANYGRFISAGIINQSAHDASCPGNCRKLS